MITLTRTPRTLDVPEAAASFSRVDGSRMRSFWDSRARERALFFVDNRLDYNDPDAQRFWKGGEEDLGKLLGALGTEVSRADHVVEVGCGVGRLTRVLARMAGRSRRWTSHPR
jgi:hypothetical protein